MLKLVPENTNINFLKVRKIVAVMSVVLVIGSIGSLVFKGLNLGVDFTGGIMIDAAFPKAPDLDKLRPRINELKLGDTSIQEFGSPTALLIRLPQQPGGESGQQVAVKKVQAELEKNYGDVKFRRVETVGGKVSAELVQKGIIAIVLALIAISFYIWFRFEWQFGAGALLSLAHDVVITLGFLVVTQLEFNLNLIAAILTIVGYSLNDTIILYDRVRENMRKHRKMDITPMINLSVNETLARTVMTSVTLLIALIALFLFGGEVIRGLTISMIVGVILGTYSSIYIASPMLIWMKLNRESFVSASKQTP